MSTGSASGDGSRAARVPALDGLRGLAILLVMLYHFSLLFAPQNAWERLLADLLAMAWAGVDLFFVLSGFLITRILLRTRRSPHSLRTFYFRRALRIFPAYYAVLCFFLLLAPHLSFLPPHGFWEPSGLGRDAAIWYWPYLSNLPVAYTGVFQHRVLAVTWSLAIEAQFYAAWPVVVRGLSVAGLTRLCVLCLALAPALRLALTLAGFGGLPIYVFTPCRLDTLAAGALVGIIGSDPARRAGLVIAAKRAGPACLFGMSAVIAWVHVSRDAAGSPLGFALLAHPLVQIAGHSLLAGLFASSLVLIVYAPARSGLNRILSIRPLEVLGKYSYAMYLVHTFVAWAIFKWIFDYRMHPDWNVGALVLNWFLGGILSLLVAMLSWNLLEAPFLRLKRYAPYQAEEGAAARDASP